MFLVAKWAYFHFIREFQHTRITIVCKSSSYYTNIAQLRFNLQSQWGDRLSDALTSVWRHWSHACCRIWNTAQMSYLYMSGIEVLFNTAVQASPFGWYRGHRRSTLGLKCPEIYADNIRVTSVKCCGVSNHRRRCFLFKSLLRLTAKRHHYWPLQREIHRW